MEAPSYAAPGLARESGPTATDRPQGRRRRELAISSLGALGVVYGDIGTSPLYAMKECLAWPYSPHAVPPDPAAVLGVTSLMLWALILVICVKYVGFVLRADNKGEGGVLALTALVGGHTFQRAGRLAVPILLGLFGAGLLFGDGIITPAISVLGAMEGLGEHSPGLAHWVVPFTIAILVALFAAQRHGTARIGNAFGPVMLLWFIAIGAFGLRWIVAEPAVLAAIDPRHGASFLVQHGAPGFLLLGLVVLVVTGGEALYADLGHFGRRPIRIAWFTVALPGLVLNYFGQAALLLTHEPGTIKNPFYAMTEGPLMIPMLVLATTAAVIASQALISGVFSLTRQALQLGFWPRVTVSHTSVRAEGQIYIPQMNWLLMIGCIALVLEFGSSSGLAAAYGFAVTGTMAITSVLFYLVCRLRWGYSRGKALALLITFLIVDLAFLLANLAKLVDGGWISLVMGLGVFTVMTTWWRGRTSLSKWLESGTVPEAVLLADLEMNPPRRVGGTAVFMSQVRDGIPSVLLHHLKHNQVLHREVVLFSVDVEPVPWIDPAGGLEITHLGLGFHRVIARVGFMQTLEVPAALAGCAASGIVAEPMRTTYYLGRETLLTTGPTRMARWRKALFAYLFRNARPPTEFFDLPPNRVIEIGQQIEL